MLNKGTKLDRVASKGNEEAFETGYYMSNNIHADAKRCLLEQGT